MVFYRPVPGGIKVVRVLHGGDIEHILAEEFGVDASTDEDQEPKESEGPW